VSTNAKGVPVDTVKLWLLKPRKSYSSLAVQLGANAHSMPPPANQPVLLLLFETGWDQLPVPLMMRFD
jgi:hypothetical protein